MYNFILCADKLLFDIYYYILYYRIYGITATRGCPGSARRDNSGKVNVSAKADGALYDFEV
jgi:hypothetical protein